jgi:hypothetical protein
MLLHGNNTNIVISNFCELNLNTYFNINKIIAYDECITEICTNMLILDEHNLLHVYYHYYTNKVYGTLSINIIEENFDNIKLYIGYHNAVLIKKNGDIIKIYIINITYTPTLCYSVVNSMSVMNVKKYKFIDESLIILFNDGEIVSCDFTGKNFEIQPFVNIFRNLDYVDKYFKNNNIFNHIISNDEIYESLASYTLNFMLILYKKYIIYMHNNNITIFDISNEHKIISVNLYDGKCITIKKNSENNIIKYIHVYDFNMIKNDTSILSIKSDHIFGTHMGLFSVYNNEITCMSIYDDVVMDQSKYVVNDDYDIIMYNNDVYIKKFNPKYGKYLNKHLKCVIFNCLLCNIHINIKYKIPKYVLYKIFNYIIKYQNY